MNASEADAMFASGDKQGYAAVAIINVVHGEEGGGEAGDVKQMSFAWQRKTPGYPTERMVGALCLFGGREAYSHCWFYTTSSRVYTLH